MATRSARTALKTYRRKRDFSATREPRGAARTTAAGARRARTAPLAFVIQKHAATRLHFDLRLEVDGAMKSWAVPKGPSRDPTTKRLAMQVEDHPMQYNAFEGTIPKGEYGGGTVMIWDRGTYECPDGGEAAMRRGLAKGHITFTLQGERLRGTWTLIQIRSDDGRPWLLVKQRDEHAKRGDRLAAQNLPSVVTGRTMTQITNAASPSSSASALRPMLASVGDVIPGGTGWAFEPKYDGVRVLAFVTDGAVTLLSRNGHDKATQFPEIVDGLAKLNARRKRSFVLDGEIVARRGKSLGRFQELQDRIGERDSTTIAAHRTRSPATLVVFDILMDGDAVLMSEPWTTRRARLESLMRAPVPTGLTLGDVQRGRGARLLATATRRGWEGIMAKRIDAPYQPGERTRDWLKLKIEQRQEFVVGGWTEPRRSRQHLGALLIGYWDNGRLQYAGHVGGGFSHEGLREMHARLAPLERKTSPFAGDIDTNEPAHWATPKVVVEVKFNEWTADGRLRQPVYLGVRDDKDPRSIRREPRSVKGARSTQARTQKART